jgi:pSer/pThr/pTyr-binding forkhead associated (FHA) protein
VVALITAVVSCKTQESRLMANVTFQVLDGVDKGRVFRDLPTPMTIGREEGNTLRLNDERVSRFHAKVQQDQEDVILTDLESTNGTRVNGHVVQIRRLQAGDCVAVGRSVLLYGSSEDIAARVAAQSAAKPGGRNAASSRNPGHSHPNPTMVQAAMEASQRPDDLNFDVDDQVRITNAGLFIGNREFPPLPLHLSPSQAARLAEILDFLHRALAQTAERIRATEEGTQIVLDYGTWQRVLAVEMLLARYHRAIADPESWKQE